MNNLKPLIGDNIITLDIIDSTSKYLNSLIKSNDILPEGTVVFARNQSNGKGLGSNKWESKAGENIAMSFFIKPEFINASENYAICRFAALAVYDFVLFYAKKQISIKWPNDIYYQNKKISGILIENNIAAGLVKFSVIGIGININQQVFISDAPNPVSLFNITGNHLDIDDCLKKLNECLNFRYKQLCNNGDKLQEEQYLLNLLGINKWLKFLKGDILFEGMIKGVTAYGHLIVEDKNGSVQEYEQKEIKFVFD